MAYLKDVTGERKVENNNQLPQIHYHVEKTEFWTKASVILAGIGIMLSILHLLIGKKK